MKLSAFLRALIEIGKQSGEIDVCILDVDSQGRLVMCEDFECIVAEGAPLDKPDTIKPYLMITYPDIVDEMDQMSKNLDQKTPKLKIVRDDLN